MTNLFGNNKVIVVDLDDDDDDTDIHERHAASRDNALGLVLLVQLITLVKPVNLSITFSGSAVNDLAVVSACMIHDECREIGKNLESALLAGFILQYEEDSDDGNNTSKP